MSDLYSNYKEPTPYDNPELFAAIYTRRSNEQDNHSLKAQEAICIKKLYEKNLILYKVYSDVISASHRTLQQRPSFSALQEDARLGLFKTIVVYRHDRLARNFYDWLRIKKFLKIHNMKIIFSELGEFDPNNYNPIETITHNMMFGIAEIEPMILADRVKITKEKRRKEGLYSAGCPPYGYNKFDIDEDKDKIDSLLLQLKNEYDIDYILPSFKYKSIYIPDPSKINIIRSIFKLFINVKTNFQPAKDICKEVNILKKNIEGKNYKKFNSRQILEVIKRPVYCSYVFDEGCFDFANLFEKSNITNTCDVNEDKLILSKNVVPIVSKETWKESILKWYNSSISHNSSNKSYIFKDLLHCETCLKNNRKDTIYLQSESYYFCMSSKCFSMKKEKLESELIAKIINDLINNKDGMNTQVIDNKIAEINKNLRKEKLRLNSQQNSIDAKFKKLMTSYDMTELKKEFEQFALTSKNIENNIRRYRTQIDELVKFKKNIKELKTHDSINTVEESFRENEQYANNILKELIKEVYISKDYELRINYKS